MLSIPVIKMDLRINIRRIAVFFGLQLASMLIAIGICTMKLIEISDIFWDTIPVIIIPMLMQMVLAYELVLHCRENGTIKFLMASPKSRACIFQTKAGFLIGTNLALFAGTTLLGVITKVYRLTGMWSCQEYICLNIGGFCLQIFLMGFCFWMSCQKDSLGSYLSFSVGIPVLFYGIYLIYYLVEKCWFLQYITIFSLFRQHWYQKGNILWMIGCAVYLLLGALFFALARRAFIRQTSDDR